MKIPQFRLDRQTEIIKSGLQAAFNRVLESGQFVLGSEVDQFENKFSRFIGSKHSIGVTSGTDALILALKANSVHAGDLVLTSPFTFFATASAILAIGAEPVFADINPTTFNLDPVAVENCLAGKCSAWQRQKIDPSKVKAILPVHLYGMCADMKEFRRLAEKYSTALIEDAAQAFGAAIDGRFAGTFGDAAAFSFFPTKNLGALGDAGCVTAQDDDIAQKLALLRVHGSRQRYIHEAVGGNFRIDALQSAFLSVKIESAQSWIEKRIGLADLYSDSLRNVEGVVVPSVLPGYRHSFHQYTIKVSADKRDDLIKHLAADGIGSMPYYPLCVHLQPAMASSGWQHGDFPEAEKCSQQVISLPMYPELTEEEITTVFQSIRLFFNNR